MATTIALYDVWASSLTYITAIMSILIVYFTYKLFFVPLNRVRLEAELGYVAEGGMTKKDVANLVQRRKLAGDLPPVYPNGWYGLVEGFSIKKGESKSMFCLGESFAVFRDENGKVHVLDAYCPHLGANLGVGGKVRGSCIECPFHGWRFRGDDGKCVHIPYADKVPEVASVKSWPCLELNGWIYVWYHAENEEPYWFPPEIKEITDGTWSFFGRTEHHIDAHIEDIPENAADVQHLKYIHGPIIMSGTDIRYMNNKMWSFAEHFWTGDWDSPKDPKEKHIGIMTVEHHIRLFGYPVPLLNVKVKAIQIGPAITYLFFTGIFGKFAILESVTPTKPLVQKMVNNVFGGWKMPTFIAKGHLLALACQVDRDIMIWNNKRYEKRPLFVKSAEDSLISKHRRWYSQFYSEHSPRINFQKDTLEF